MAAVARATLGCCRTRATRRRAMMSAGTLAVMARGTAMSRRRGLGRGRRKALVAAHVADSSGSEGGRDDLGHGVEAGAGQK
jgi:hypothetical protein